jgi:protein tyrosine phosphatase (PTP) superfamily phosphohydrolase (DUF442 family)
MFERKSAGKRIGPSGPAVLLAMLAGLAGCAPAAPKNPQWARPIQSDEIPNFHQVSRDLYRGGQPSVQGFAELKARGVKTVVNLRRTCSDAPDLAGTGMDYVEIPCKAWDAHQRQQAAEFLKIVTDRKRTPVFVHCDFGGDRTGMMVAVYRLCVSGWTKEQALEEMRDDQFEFHEIWDDMVQFVTDLDVPAIKKQASI